MSISGNEAVQSLQALSSAKSIQPIGAASKNFILPAKAAQLLPLLGSESFSFAIVYLILELTQLRRVSAETPISRAILEICSSSGAERTSPIASRRNSGGYGELVLGIPPPLGERASPSLYPSTGVMQVPYGQ